MHILKNINIDDANDLFKVSYLMVERNIYIPMGLSLIKNI